MKTFIFFSLLLAFTTNVLFSEDSEEFIYISKFKAGGRGGFKPTQVEQFRNEFINEMGKYTRYELVGPEAEEAIIREQLKIEAEGGASMMCRAEECRRRLLKVASADAIIEGTVELLDSRTGQIAVELHSRKIVEDESGSKKQQTMKVFIQKFRVTQNRDDNRKFQELAINILAKKVSEVEVTKAEEEAAMGAETKPSWTPNLNKNALRSAVLPGWGQINNDNKTRGYIYMSTYLFFLLNSYLHNEQYNSAVKSYKDIGTPLAVGYGIYSSSATGDMTAYFLFNSVYFKNKSDDVALHANAGNQMALGALLVWGISVVDVFLSKSPATVEEAPKESAFRLRLDSKIVPVANKTESYYSISLEQKF